jgi:membrane protein DedA with SNARE-associated domain
MLLGFFWAVQGHGSPLLVFAACVAGSTLGAAAAFGLGQRYGLSVARRISRLGVRSGRSGVGHRADDLLRRFGAPVLVTNRFLPVVRGLMLYGAGALRLPFGICMAYTLLSNLAWAGLLWGLAHVSRGVGWAELLGEFRATSRVAASVALLLVASLVLLVLRRERSPA